MKRHVNPVLGILTVVVVVFSAFIAGLITLYNQLLPSDGGSFRVKNVQQEQWITVHTSEPRIGVHAFSFYCRGRLDGAATFTFGDQVERVEGKFDIQLGGGDYYADTAKFKYTPDGVKSGKFVVEYSFHY